MNKIKVLRHTVFLMSFISSYCTEKDPEVAQLISMLQDISPYSSTHKQQDKLASSVQEKIKNSFLTPEGTWSKKALEIFKQYPEFKPFICQFCGIDISKD